MWSARDAWTWNDNPGIQGGTNQRLLAIRKARISRAFLIKERKFSEKKNGWLATQWDSNRSPGNFPANGEFYREYCNPGLIGPHFVARNRSAAATSCAIPYSG